MLEVHRSIMLPAMTLLAAWWMWREWRQIRAGTTFSPDEQTVLGFQMIVLLSVIMLSNFTWFPPSQAGLVEVAIQLVFGVAWLFIALTSIIYRVSIFRGRGHRGPQRGGSAIAVGVVMLCAMLAVLLITQARS